MQVSGRINTSLLDVGVDETSASATECKSKKPYHGVLACRPECLIGLALIAVVEEGALSKS